MTKRALIFGVGGMDGSHCADLLLEENYEVHGMHRRSSYDNLARVAYCRDRLTLHAGDVTDFESVFNAVAAAEPHELYNFADQDDVRYSHKVPLAQMAATAGGCANVLQATRLYGCKVRVFQPLSATMFGNVPAPQNEQTPFAPASPYAVAKVAAYYLCQHYRREYGLFVGTAIYFNHDGPRRGPGYLLQKIARGERPDGDLSAVVDIGYAPEYVEAAWRILQHDRPDDFVIGTGRGYTIESLMGRERPRYIEQPDTLALVAFPLKARTELGWVAQRDAWDVLQLLRARRIEVGDRS